MPGGGEKAGSDSRPDGPRLDLRFPRSHRLRARRQFLAVYADGYRMRSASFTLFGLRNTLGHSRLGITVTRKVGGAVVRNRAKRRLRELFRRHRGGLQPAMDLVINAHPSIVGREAGELEREVVSCFQRLTRRLSR